MIHLGLEEYCKKHILPSTLQCVLNGTNIMVIGKVFIDCVMFSIFQMIPFSLSPLFPSGPDMSLTLSCVSDLLSAMKAASRNRGLEFRI